MALAMVALVFAHQLLVIEYFMLAVVEAVHKHLLMVVELVLAAQGAAVLVGFIKTMVYQERQTLEAVEAVLAERMRQVPHTRVAAAALASSLFVTLQQQAHQLPQQATLR
jgi:hypothetical protein